MINGDMIKAMRCVASQDEAGNCYMDRYNLLHKDEAQMCCNEQVAKLYAENEKIVCPYSQAAYGVCAASGDLCAWLGEAAYELEKILLERMPPRQNIEPQERTRAAVRATGNKWAMENFNATHD
ncbi:MAG: hypothetical protein LUG99_00260 [Lachnospiraceae bacterium]|nr:hypothetical protein [Lachnospiraceae bacterium]